MGLILNGNAPNKILYNGAEVTLYFNGSKIWPNVAPVLDEVTIGTQTWKTKNLAIDDGQGGIVTQTVNYGQGDVVEYYYTWEAAVRVAASISGWHLPSYSEMWDTLRKAVDVGANAGTKLKSTYGWSSGNGTDDYGFAAFPAGTWTSGGGFKKFGSEAYFWTATVPSTTTVAYYCHFTTDTSMSGGTFSKKVGCSVRLVKDS